MQKNIKKIIAIIITFSIFGMLTVKAAQTNNVATGNYDYEVTIQFTGTDADSDLSNLSNKEIAKKIYEYYKNMKSTKNDLLYELNCSSIFGSNLQIKAFNTFINNIFFSIIIFSIIILIILSMIDFIRGIISNDEDYLKKAFKNTKNRLISIVILILLPLILNTIINFIDNIEGQEDFKIGKTNDICSNDEKSKKDYIKEDITIQKKDWSSMKIKDSDKEEMIFLGWTTNKNGPSVIFKNKIYPSELIKEDLKLYSLFMDKDKEEEKYNSITLHNKGEKINHFYQTKKSFINSSIKKGFNYYADYNEWYYANEDGKILTGKQTINDKTYYFGKDGVVRFGWVQIESDKYYFNTKGEMVFGEQNIGGTTYNFDEETGKLLKGITMRYTISKEIPTSLLNQYLGSNYDPSIVIADEYGNVLASRKPDLRREGASTTKVFTGYAAIKLLDLNKDKIKGTRYAAELAGKYNNHGIEIGQSIPVSRAAVKFFPGSSNETADSIPTAIGYKYYNCSSDIDAFNKGMKKINEFIKSIGCTNSNLANGSGILSHGMNHFSAPYGLQTGGNKSGHTANDLALVSIIAMKDTNFVNAFANYSSCENRIGHYPKCRTLAKDKKVDGLFYIKSGSGLATHGIWAFNKSGKRYYIAVLGIQSSKNKLSFAKGLYDWAIKDLIK